MSEMAIPESRRDPDLTRSSGHPQARHYETIDDAAAHLGMTAQALRARCRRGAVREGREVRCHLGDGVVATKFGRTWRVRFTPV
jgi:hypothetical protein